MKTLDRSINDCNIDELTFSEEECKEIVTTWLEEAEKELKNIAEENDIPIVENVELAHMLYEKTEIGEEIPPELYKAVAEILAFCI